MHSRVKILIREVSYIIGIFNIFRLGFCAVVSTLFLCFFHLRPYMERFLQEKILLAYLSHLQRDCQFHTLKVNFSLATLQSLAYM